MKKYQIGNNYYELIEEYRDGFDLNEVTEKMTDYFDDFDYIIGDWAYGKLRLKGFCEKDNPRFNEINDYTMKDDYLKNNCAYECRYFVLKKVKKEKIEKE
ncbi:MAG: YutD family protein [Mollicutes bacterium]|nr:YutD family protein [Mollicutes bacterium]